MPSDSRRNQGPETSTPYTLYADKNVFDDVKSLKEKLFKDGVRKDGRTLDEHRRIYMKTSIVSQAKGSAYIEQDKTKVICSVFDPREIPRKSEYSVNGELYCEFKYAPFSCVTRKGHQSDADEKECSLILRRALEPAVCRHEFPNFQVDVYALVLENDGSALSAAITCASLALADASVPMYDLVASTTLGVFGDTKILDPTAEETSLCNFSSKKNPNHGTVMLSFLSAHQQISELSVGGSLDMDCVKSAIKILVSASDEIYPLSQQCLVKSVSRTQKRKKNENKANAVSSEVNTLTNETAES